MSGSTLIVVSKSRGFVGEVIGDLGGSYEVTVMWSNTGIRVGSTVSEEAKQLETCDNLGAAKKLLRRKGTVA